MDAGSDSGIPLEQGFHFQTEPAIICDTLKVVEAAFEGKTMELRKIGIIVFLNEVIKLKPQLLPAEAFRDVKYLKLEGD